MLKSSVVAIVFGAALVLTGSALAQRPATNDKPVDVCSLLSVTDAESLIGKLAKPPAAGKPTGSMLGSCGYITKQASISISARPARELDATLKSAGAKDKPPQPVPGLGERAFDTPIGLFVQPAGKSYFLQIIATRIMSFDHDLAIAAARKVKQ